MRRFILAASTSVGILLIATPASAFAHNNVSSPVLHAVLDGLTLLVVTAPLWTAYFWGAARRRFLLALVAVVQVPVAVMGFVPIADPTLHLVSLSGALALTAFSLWYVRTTARGATATAPVR